MKQFLQILLSCFFLMSTILVPAERFRYFFTRLKDLEHIYNMDRMTAVAFFSIFLSSIIYFLLRRFSGSDPGMVRRYYLGMLFMQTLVIAILILYQVILMDDYFILKNNFFLITFTLSTAYHYYQYDLCRKKIECFHL
jgi:hypothetical protein